MSRNLGDVLVEGFLPPGLAGATAVQSPRAMPPYAARGVRVHCEQGHLVGVVAVDIPRGDDRVRPFPEEPILELEPGQEWLAWNGANGRFPARELYAEQLVDGMMLARGLDPVADRPYLARNWDCYAAVLAERVVQGCCRACGSRFARLHVGRPKPDGSRRLSWSLRGPGGWIGGPTRRRRTPPRGASA